MASFLPGLSRMAQGANARCCLVARHLAGQQLIQNILDIPSLCPRR